MITDTQEQAVKNFLTAFDTGVLEDVGPQLTCTECDAFVILLEAFNEEQKAKALLHSHCLKDSEVQNDSPEHLEIKAELEQVKCRYCGQHSFIGDCGCQDGKGQP